MRWFSRPNSRINAVSAAFPPWREFGPDSTNHPSTRPVLTEPPTRSVRSKIRTRCPKRDRRYAAIRPVAPAPSTAIDFNTGEINYSFALKPPMTRVGGAFAIPTSRLFLRRPWLPIDHGVDERFDALDFGLRQDAVAEVENMSGPAPHRGE